MSQQDNSFKNYSKSERDEWFAEREGFYIYDAGLSERESMRLVGKDWERLTGQRIIRG